MKSETQMKTKAEIKEHLEHLKEEYPLGLSLHRNGFIDALKWVLNEEE